MRYINGRPAIKVFRMEKRRCVGRLVILISSLCLAFINAKGDEVASVTGRFLSFNYTQKADRSKVSSAKGSFLRYKIDYSFEYNITTTLKRIKKPLLRFAVVMEAEDGTRGYGCFYYKDQFSTLKFDDNDPAISPVTLSQAQTEVEVALYRNVKRQRDRIADYMIWGELAGGMSSVDPAVPYKIIAWRLELWCAGELLAERSLPGELELKKLGMPSDWFVYKKYPDKMKYLRAHSGYQDRD